MGLARYLSVLLFILLFSSPCFAHSLITLASSTKASNDYSLAGLLCRLVNKNTLQSGMKCGALATSGAFANLSLLKNQGAEFAFMPSDVQQSVFHAKKEAFSQLRSVFSLTSQSFHFVVRKDSSIHDFNHLKGRVINFGTQDSAERNMLEKAFSFKGWSKENFKRVFELRVNEQSDALCSNVIEVMIVAASLPSQKLINTAKKCDIRLIALDEKIRQKMLENYSFYQPSSSIFNDKAIASIAILTTVVSTDAVSEEMVYNFTKGVFEQLDKLKAFHPALFQLDKNTMASEGLVAPLHAGALRYYQEMGLILNAN